MEREKALEMALGQIEKQYGKGSVMKMGEKSSMDVETVPTGALSLDIALGVGGLPRGVQPRLGRHAGRRRAAAHRPQQVAPQRLHAGRRLLDRGGLLQLFHDVEGRQGVHHHPQGIGGV